MHTVFAVAFASILSAGVVVAADYPPVYQPVPPIAVARVYDWTGIYIGANGGYGWAPASATLSLSNPFFFFNGVSTGWMAGGIAGGQIGANYQKGIAVIGLEFRRAVVRAAGG